MAVAIMLVIIEVILLIFTFPVKVKISGHASLLFESAEIDVSLFSLRIIAIRAKMKEDRLTLSFNGKTKDGDKEKENRNVLNADETDERKDGVKKPTKKKDKSLNPVIYMKLFEMMKKERIFEFWNLSLLFSGYEAKNTSMIIAFIYAVIMPRLKMNVYNAKRENTFEFDGRIKIKINLLQILTLISYKTRLSARHQGLAA